jgi:hypothetical protein
MIADLLLALAIILLLSAWLGSFFDKRVRLGLVPLWRRILSWTSLLALTISAIELIRASDALAVAHSYRLDIIAPFARVGLMCTAATFVTCWFSPWKTLACLLASTVLIAFLWFMGLLAA